MPAAIHKPSQVAGMVAAALVPCGIAFAGGPLLVDGDGNPVVWNTAQPIAYSTDGGRLSATIDQAAAQARVQAMFAVWQDVTSSDIAYVRSGLITTTGDFSDGDVSTAVEYNAVQDSCLAGEQSPIVYDEDGSIFEELGMDEAVIGFAGPCALAGAIPQWISGQAVMNGLFQDGVTSAASPELSEAGFDAAFIHEFGHFSGLDHSQVNVNCLAPNCGADNIAGLPTMFPFLTDDSQVDLAIDDKAWISRLYPQVAGASSFSSTHGTITGVVLFSDGESHAQFVNVVARPVDTGANQDRTGAVSGVSGTRFGILHGNPITGFGDNFGTMAPGDIGRYEIFVPPGSYTVEVETIDPSFVGGSSVGGILIPMPGAAPAPIGPINVTADSISSVNDITLIGSDPRFDQFEGP